MASSERARPFATRKPGTSGRFRDQLRGDGHRPIDRAETAVYLCAMQQLALHPDPASLGDFLN
jgi:hypothetical protein